jgi:tRNA(Ile)-lysidine synthase
MTLDASLGSEERVITEARKALEPWSGQSLIVAVSGGSDSVALLRACAEIREELAVRLFVAHFHHGVRGEAADADARYVAELAEQLALPFDSGRWSPSRPGHFESEARRARYAWLEEIARSRGAPVVVVGHTSDDQAETILHRILRGTGLRGLAGMPAKRALSPSVTLVRPLLNVARTDLRRYLATIGQDHREDASNSDLTRTRARLRHDLLPKLAAEYNPCVAEALVRLGRLATASERSLCLRLRTLLRRVTLNESPTAVQLDRRILCKLGEHTRAELLRMAWRRQGWPEGHMTAARWIRLARSAGRTKPEAHAVYGIELSLTPSSVILRRSTAPTETLCPKALTVPGSVEWLGAHVTVSLQPGEPHDELIDFDCVVLPLVVRGPEPGDRFEPLGMDGHTQPLNDFFRARALRRCDRKNVPLVCDAQGIIWVVGHRIAHRVRQTPATRRRMALGSGP